MCRAGIGHYETLAASIAVMFVAFLLGIISCKLLGSIGAPVCRVWHRSFVF